MPSATTDDGVRINYAVAGEGPPLVLNHGLGGDLEMFRPAIERLRGEYTVIAWDNRGCGESEARGPYTLRRFSDDLLAVLASAGVERAIIAGVSWGGVVAQRFALDHPDRVSALVVDSSSSEVNERAAEGWLARGHAYVAAARGDSAPSSAAEAGRAQGQGQGQGLGGHALPDEAFAQRTDPTAFMAQCEAIAALRTSPLTAELRRIACPTLCIVGEDDNIAGVGGTVIMSRAIPDAKLVIVPGCGHGVVGGAPDVFDAELRELAAKASPADGSSQSRS